MFSGLELDPRENVQYGDQAILREKFTNIFLTKTRAEWTNIFKDLDACFSPVLDYDEAHTHEHNVYNKSFLQQDNNHYVPAPAPKFSRTPGVSKEAPQPNVGQHSVQILEEAGFTSAEIVSFLKTGTVESNQTSKM